MPPGTIGMTPCAEIEARTRCIESTARRRPDPLAPWETKYGNGGEAEFSICGTGII